jgi:hypothetical protein
MDMGVHKRMLKLQHRTARKEPSIRARYQIPQEQAVSKKTYYRFGKYEVEGTGSGNYAMRYRSTGISQVSQSKRNAIAT